MSGLHFTFREYKTIVTPTNITVVYTGVELIDKIRVNTENVPEKLQGKFNKDFAEFIYIHPFQYLIDNITLTTHLLISIGHDTNIAHPATYSVVFKVGSKVEVKCDILDFYKNDEDEIYIELRKKLLGTLVESPKKDTTEHSEFYSCASEGTPILTKKHGKWVDERGYVFVSDTQYEIMGKLQGEEVVNLTQEEVEEMGQFFKIHKSQIQFDDGVSSLDDDTDVLESQPKISDALIIRILRLKKKNPTAKSGAIAKNLKIEVAVVDGVLSRKEYYTDKLKSGKKE